MDVALALNRVGGDAGLLKEMADLFIKDLPGSMDALRHAIDEGNANAIERAAHKLKGSIGNFAAQPACDAALTLEVLGRGGSIAEAAPAYAELEIEITRLKSAMADLGVGEAHQ
jgi:HPt (histidine-containing phosphotransfer) domain-containing protein